MSLLVLERPFIPPARYAEFARRFREAVAGAANQEETANRIGLSQQTVSAVMNGRRPSRNFVERFIEAYGQEGHREEWLTLADYGKQPSVEDERLLIAEEAADRVMERSSGAEIYYRGLRALNQRLGRPVRVDLSGGSETLTVEVARQLLAELERLVERGEA